MAFLPSALVLGLAALAAAWLTARRPSPGRRQPERQVASRALVLATSLQAVHFAEEAFTGFHVRLAEVVGVPEMPFGFFVAFNLAWLGTWVAAIPGIHTGKRPAFFVAWFLAIAGMVNGVAHPVLAAVSRTYFPGLVSAPVVGLACVWLWVRLREATDHHPRKNGVVS